MHNRLLHSRLLLAQAILLALSFLAGNAHATGPAPSSSGPSAAAQLQDAVNDQQNHRPWLRIEAFTDVPLTGATVRVYNLYGRRLFEQSRATDIHGRFHVLIPDLPRDLRVTIVWRQDPDQDDDSDGPGYSSAHKVKLSADVRDFDPVNDTVYLNPATTIVSRLLERFPQLNLAQAKDLVRRLLGVPLTASFGVALREGRQFHPAYFSEVQFVREANLNGGIDRLIQALVAEAQARPIRPHRFAPPSPKLGGVASFIARNLASGALSWASGQGAGWVARTAGLSTAGATAEAVANLQAGLDDLQSSVKQLSDQLSALQDELSAELTQTQYTVIATQALQTASKVDLVSNNLTNYAVDCPPLAEGAPPVQPSEYCVNQKDTVVTQLKETDVNGAFEALASNLLDNGAAGYHGMLHLFSQSVGQSVRFFRPADSTKIQTMADYFQQVEVQAANLKVELSHFNGAPGPNGEGTQALISFLGNASIDPPTDGTFQTTLNNEAKLVFPAVPIDTVINTKDRTMWLTTYPSILTYNACFGQPPAGGGDWIYPLTQNVPIHPPQVFLSPTSDQAKALVDGWSGSSANQWLIDQTKAVAPDSPVSAGFPGIVAATPPYGYTCTVYPTFWTRILTGNKYTIYDVTYPIYYVLNLANGQLSSSTSYLGAAGRYSNWEFLDRTLDAGEQYYWYP